jgi:hypothetical protein
MAHKQRPVIMTPQDKVKVIAEYDGWRQDEVVDERGRLYNNPYRAHLGDSLGEGFAFLGNMRYLTSLDWLHPAAMKVLDELDVMISKSKSDYESTGIGVKGYFIRHACQYKPVNGEYIDLFNAVYEGIEFLNQNKPTA